MTLLRNNPHLTALYNDAHRYPNRENPSIEFWKAVLHYHLPAPRWNHARELAPCLDKPDDLRRMDVVSRKFVKKASGYFYSGILEGKRPNYNQTDVERVEQQLLEYTSSYIDSCDENSLWAISTLGTRARFWFHKRGDENLTAYHPRTTAFYNDAPYIDANASDTTGLVKAFEAMQECPWPTDKIRGISPDIPTQPPSSNPFTGSGARAALRLHSSPGHSVANTSYDPNTRGYTVPYVQSSAYAASPTTPVSSNPVESRTESDRGRFSSPSEEGSPEHRPPKLHPLLPADAIKVDVMIETSTNGDFYHFYHGEGRYRKKEDDWKDRTAVVEGKNYDCVMCTGEKTGLNFYTWNLRDLPSYDKKKGKEKRK